MDTSPVSENPYDSALYLQQIRKHSLEQSTRLESALATLDFPSLQPFCIFAVGSVGRLEIGGRSDLDGVVVLEAGVNDSLAVEQMMSRFEELYLQTGFKVAKGSGIYRQPVTTNELLELARRGSLDESPGVFGKRIQMLLDARPLLNSHNFAILQKKVLDWYLPKINHKTSYTFFINELQRYFHSYASWQMFKFEQSEDDGWYLRQAKLRVTRVITIGAMMLLIGIAMHTGDAKIIRESLSRTPIERIIFAFSFYNEHEMCSQLVAVYETALQVLLNEDTRTEMVRESPICFEDLDRAKPPSYKKIHDASEEMMSLLCDYVMNRRGEWPNKFFRSWWF